MRDKKRLTYHGIVYSKKNSKRIVRNRRTGDMALVSSKAAIANEEAMANEFRQQLDEVGKKVQQPCMVEIVLYEPNYTRRDLDNQATSVLDALKLAGAIEDDDFKHVSALLVTFGGIDRKDPRAEVTIIERGVINGAF